MNDMKEFFWDFGREILTKLQGNYRLFYEELDFFNFLEVPHPLSSIFGAAAHGKYAVSWPEPSTAWNSSFFWKISSYSHHTK